MSTDGNIFYYRLASLYDSLSAAEFKLGRQLIQKGSLKAGDQVLEVGCGTGRLLVEIARRVLPGGTATGLDLSEPMLGIARKRIEKNKLTGNTKLVQGDALNLPFPDCSFEKVFSCFTLELFAEKDLARALSEMYRVLKPGGLVGIASLNAETPQGRAERLYWWFHKKLPSLVDCRPIPVKALVETSPLQLQSLEERKLYGIPVALAVSKRSG